MCNFEEFENELLETNGYHCHVSLTNNRLSPSNLNGEPRLKVGDRYYVRRSDDVWHSAKIVEIKPCQDEETGRFEYYVHYDDCNRRLDEWVLIDRFNFTSSPKPKGNEKSDDEPFRKITRNQKRKHDEINKIDTAPVNGVSSTSDLEERHENLSKVKYIDCIQIGKFEIDTWYSSPYPDEYGKQKKLWICEYCLRYMSLEKTYRYHQGECIHRQPPGDQIYFKGSLSVYEVDGKHFKLYCQNLCLLAKLFLDEKTLFYDVELFLFYVLTKTDKHGSHLVGYFSKEKESQEGNNLACILTLPPYQKMGFGKFLIELSYELSKLDNLIGSPERPLSDLGRLSYISYWSCAVLDVIAEFVDFGRIISFKRLSAITSIAEADVVTALQNLDLLRYRKSKSTVMVTPKLVREIQLKFQKLRITVDTNYLLYIPLRERLTSDVKE